MLNDLVLCRTLNHKIIQLWFDTEHQKVGVKRKDGSYQYVPWLGFINVSDAKNLGIPVKLHILRIGRGTRSELQWKQLKSGEHVQGCGTSKGAYALVDTSVRVI